MNTSASKNEHKFITQHTYVKMPFNISVSPWEHMFLFWCGTLEK